MYRRSAAVRAVAFVVVGLLLAGCSSGGGGIGSGGIGGSTGSGTSSPTGTTSEQVSFTSDGNTTYGTLEIPAHRNGQKLAAALILAGSGPTDRNGNQPPSVVPYNLEYIANALAQQGIMTLRFDKYASGQTGLGSFASDPGSLTLRDFFDEAKAAYAFLRRQPLADPTRLLLVGHSEGGMYALDLATTVSPKPAGLALIEPQDVRELTLIVVQLAAQLRALVKQGQITTAQANALVADIQRQVANFRAGRPTDLTGLPASVVTTWQGIFAQPAYNRPADAVYPPTLAAKVASGTRVLVTDSPADTNIPPSTIGPLVNALKQAGTTGPGLVSLHNVDHDLFAAPNTTGSSLDPQVVSALDGWAQPYAAQP
jgi:alpha-beta hydrolase superfamily lysophospholipase